MPEIDLDQGRGLNGQRSRCSGRRCFACHTIDSAGYNVWYRRDEFRYLWKKMSGDVSLAADIAFPDAAGFGDRKALLVIRQDLDDDSREALVALHGAGVPCACTTPGSSSRSAASVTAARSLMRSPPSEEAWIS